MMYEQLSKDSKDYIDRYSRKTGKTKEQVMQEKIVQCIIDEYEHGNKNRTIFV